MLVQARTLTPTPERKMDSHGNPPGVHLERPWLTLDLYQPMQILSWALNRPGFVVANRIVWREVRNADLPEGFDVLQWLRGELAERGDAESVAFLTSRNLESVRTADARFGDTGAFVVATVGLSNAERIGSRQRAPAKSHGTINVAVCLDAALSQTGLIEALSIAAQARTAAVMDAEIKLPNGLATGTGTDCLAVAVPAGRAADACDYAGLHTDVGEVVGRAVYDAVYAGALHWKSTYGKDGGA